MSAVVQPAGDEAPLFDGEFLRKLERLELLARKVFRGHLRGEHTTRRRGTGLEFADFRRYRPGDDFRYIDWNIFSRLDRLFLKLYTTEEDVTLNLLIDTSASMGFGTPRKFDHARRLAAALAYIGLNNLDRVGLTAFGDGPGQSLEGLKSRHQVASVLDFLTDLPCAGPTRVGDSLRDFGALTRGAGLAVLITDLVPPEEAVRGVEALRHGGHDVVLVQLLAEEEVDPPLEGALRIVDAEDGGELRVTVDPELRRLYHRQLEASLEQIAAHCRRAGVEYLRASTAIPFEDLVLRYLRRGMTVR